AEGRDLDPRCLGPGRHGVGRPTGLVSCLEDERPRTVPREVRGCDEPVVSSADDDHVEAALGRHATTIRPNVVSSLSNAVQTEGRSDVALRTPTGSPSMDSADANRGAAGPASASASASTSGSTSGSRRSRSNGESMSAASRAVAPPIRYTGCGPKVRSTGPARMYAIARPHDRTASNAAIVRLRTASGVRRCMIPFSATIVMPSLVPMISRHTRATGNTGAHPTPNAAIAIPKDAIASHTGSVRDFMNRPQAAPRTDPVPQHV